MKTTRRTLCATALACLSAMAGVTGAQAAEVNLRLHTFEPPQGTSLSKSIKPWIAAVEKASQGRIKITVFPAMQLGGKPPELYGQARDGVVDIAWTVLGYTPGLFPKTEVFELPFMTRDATGASKALWQYVQDNAMDEFKDVHLLTLHTHGPGLLHTATPVKTAADLQGMKLRGGSRVVSELLAKLGATPVGMPITSVGEALSKGVLQGTAIPYEVVPVFKVQQLVKNHTEMAGGVALYNMPFAMVMNKKRYDAMPADLKKIIDDNCNIETAAKFGQAMDEGDARARKMIVGIGNNVTALSADETDRWIKVGDAVRAEWVTKANAAGLDANGLIAKAETLIKQYSTR